MKKKNIKLSEKNTHRKIYLFFCLYNYFSGLNIFQIKTNLKKKKKTLVQCRKSSSSFFFRLEKKST